LSSNNIIFGYQVIPEESPEDLVIDSNEKARAIIAKQEKAYKEKLLAEERERRLEAMREAGTEIPEGMDADEFLGLADTIMAEEEPEEPQVDYAAEAREEAERIIADAQAQAQEIIEAAESNAEALKTMARQDGRNEGYNEGTQRAAMELQDAKNQMEAEVSQIQNDFMNRQMELLHDERTRQIYRLMAESIHEDSKQ